MAISMRLSTSTNVMHRIHGVWAISMEDCLRRCAEAGFRVLDMNFCDISEGQPLTKPDWEDWVDRLSREAEKRGLEFSQSHAPFYNVCDDLAERRDFREEMVRRAIVASGRLGVKWVTMHAGTVSPDSYSPRRSREKNLAYFEPHLALAKQCGVGIAIENMADFKEHERRYTAAVEELIDLVDSFQDDSVGICWDFGHANLTRVDQAAALRQIGKRLKATHVADNHGKTDEHLAPFYGDIRWEPLMDVLREIGYQGDFTYEIHKFVQNVPDPFRDAQLAYLVQLGNWLVNRFEAQAQQ